MTTGHQCQVWFLLITNFCIATMLLGMPEPSYHIWQPFCPANCTCSYKYFEYFKSKTKIVNCTNIRTSTVPVNISSAAEVLLLPRNNIKKLKVLPKMKTLKYLDLSNNRISLIDNLYLFQPFKDLRYLSMKNNNLDKLLHGTFSGLKHLDELDLSNNEIRSIQTSAFGGLNHLKYLNLEGNKISKLDKHWFNSMASLNKLSLSKNLLTKLDSSTFLILTELSTLQLSYNQIRTIDSNAFSGLDRLRILNLSNNSIRLVPGAPLQSVPNVNILILDGNPIFKLQKYAFSHVNVTEISVSFLPDLILVEADAFFDLPHLQMLLLHDNPGLLFIDPSAFQNVPSLQTLYLHNNQLNTLPSSILNSLPALSEIHFYHNPLRCDCNVYWIKQSLLYPNVTGLVFAEDNKLICDSPLNKTNRQLKHVPLLLLKRVCAPTTLPLFKDHYGLSLGEELRLECHALGVPHPQILWRLPNGDYINSSYVDDRVQVNNECTLIVRYAKTSDAGTYSCRAENDISYDISSTNVTVSNKAIQLIAYGISNTFLTVTWNGTTHRRMIADYQIQYRKSGTNDDFRVIHLGPYSYRYTIQELKPLTTYEFCIIYVYETETYTVNCINATTKEEPRIKKGIYEIVSKKIITGVCTVVAAVIVVTCAIALVKKFHRRKDYEDPLLDKSDPMSHIPLENLYHPPSTPLCSSRTSLINSQA